MNFKTRLAVAVTTSLFLSGLSQAADASPTFTPEQQAQIGKIAADYLVAHPEVLVQASQTLQAQQEDRQQQTLVANVLKNQQALLNDKDTPTYGPANASVAVIEFFDYQCIYCSKLAPELEKVMKASPNVRFIFKEWPIFAGRWENSGKAALRGLAIWKEKGAQAYMAYHNGIYHTQHNEGALTEEDIAAASNAAGYKPTKDADYNGVLAKNNVLAQQLGLTGTPGLIVMPVKNATAENISVLPGAVPAEDLLQAIQKAAH